MIKAWPKYIFFIVLIHTFSFVSFSKYKKKSHTLQSPSIFLDIVNAIKWKNQTINWRTTKFAVLLILFIIYGNFQWTSSEKDIIRIKVMWTLTFYYYRVMTLWCVIRWKNNASKAIIIKKCHTCLTYKADQSMWWKTQTTHEKVRKWKRDIRRQLHLFEQH